MLATETISAFFFASVLLAIAPGPDNLFVLTQSALHGKLSGLFVMFGLCTGLLVHTAAVAFGVAVVFQASALAFNILKITGGIYLIFLAWQSLRAKPNAIRTRREQKKRLGALYRRGIVMNVTNPKVAIFFLAFLPQFADPKRGYISLQLTILGSLFIIATIIVFAAVALLGGTLGDWLNRSPMAQRAMNWVAGAVFLGLALKLFIAER